MNTNQKNHPRSPRTIVTILAITFLVFSPFVQADMPDEDPFSMSIVDIRDATHDNTLVIGRVISGSTMVGASVCVPLSTGEAALRKVLAIQHEGATAHRADEGQRVGLLVSDTPSGQVDMNVKARINTDCDPNADRDTMH